VNSEVLQPPFSGVCLRSRFNCRLHKFRRSVRVVATPGPRLKTVKPCRRLRNIPHHCQRVESADGREVESRRMRPRRARKRQSVRPLPRLSREPLFEFSPRIQARGVAACRCGLPRPLRRLVGHPPQRAILDDYQPAVSARRLRLANTYEGMYRAALSRSWK
jgi:hypothetical protein